MFVLVMPPVVVPGCRRWGTLEDARRLRDWQNTDFAAYSFWPIEAGKPRATLVIMLTQSLSVTVGSVGGEPSVLVASVSRVMCDRRSPSDFEASTPEHIQDTTC